MSYAFTYMNVIAQRMRDGLIDGAGIIVAQGGPFPIFELA